MFRETLRLTRQAFFGRVAALVGASELDERAWEDIEALLIQADVGVETALAVTDRLRTLIRRNGLTTRQQMVQALKEVLVSHLPSPGPMNLDPDRLLNIVLIVGVNGSGKTTTIAKLASRLTGDGWKVLLAAADTFRAAAVDQLEAWGERVGVPVIVGQAGGDPGAVVYDAIRAARARHYNLLLIDTAGRLHTQFNLMEELKKLQRVAAKSVHEAPHEVWLVLDGTTGQNALAQARHFKEALNVTGAIVTKLDSTARGGMIFAIGQELTLPVRYVGVGETLFDLVPFDPQTFVENLFVPA